METNVRNWNVEDVGNWLKTHDLPYIARFEKEGIDGSALEDMDEFDFEILEIKECHRNSILCLMKQAKTQAKTQAQVEEISNNSLPFYGISPCKNVNKKKRRSLVFPPSRNFVLESVPPSLHTPPSSWSPQDIFIWLKETEFGPNFLRHSICGEALLNLSRNDLLYVLGIPMDQLGSFEKAIVKLKKIDEEMSKEK